VAFYYGMKPNVEPKSAAVYQLNQLNKKERFRKAANHKMNEKGADMLLTITNIHKPATDMG
jgi:hypothetical protein